MWAELISGECYLEPADIVGTKNKTAGLSRLIRLASTSPAEHRAREVTQLNHIEVALGWRLDIIGAVSSGMRVTDMLHQYVGARHEVVVFRRSDLTPAQRAVVAHAMLALEGTKYGHGKLLLHVFDYVLSTLTAREQYMFRRVGRIARRPICSGSAAWAAEKVGWKLGPNRDMPWERVQPDDWWDDATKWNKERYQIVCCTEGFAPLLTG